MATDRFHFREWFQAVRSEHDRVTDAVLMVNMHRLRLMALVVSPLTLVLGVFYWLSTAGGDSQVVAWSRAHAWADFTMAGVMALLGLGAHYVIRLGRAVPLAHGFIRLSIFWTLGSTVATSTLDQLYSPGITAFLFGSILIGAVPLMRPRQALPLFLGAYVLLYYALALTQQDLALLHIGRVNGLAAAVLSFFVSVVLWRQSTANILLHMELTTINDALKSSNDALAAKQGELEMLAQHDGLTGLYNRRAFTLLAQEELARVRRYPGDTAILMADIDFFKKVNDVYGHPAGDEVLRHMANCLSRNVRGSDVVARIGGEEFMVLLPQTSVKEASLLAEKLRIQVQDSPAQVGDLHISITASFGLTGVAAGQTASVDEIYTAADNALYGAKHQGRNRVVMCALGQTLQPESPISRGA